MRWFAATVALLCASAALVVGVYLRDRVPSSWLPPPRHAATVDTETILMAIHCPAHVCTYRVASYPQPNHWLARIFTGSTTVCFDIDLLAFDVNETHGLTGATRVRCG